MALKRDFWRKRASTFWFSHLKNFQQNREKSGVFEYTYT